MYNIYDVSTYYDRNKYAYLFGKKFLSTSSRSGDVDKKGVLSPFLQGGEEKEEKKEKKEREEWYKCEATRKILLWIEYNKIRLNKEGETYKIDMDFILEEESRIRSDLEYY